MLNANESPTSAVIVNYLDMLPATQVNSAWPSLGGQAEWVAKAGK